MSAATRLRRSYFDCRFGQLHVYQAIPPGGGFDEATALLCIPGAQGCGRFFASLLGPFGADRSVYAPDLPGFGESDRAGAGAGPLQYAQALVDLLDSLRQRRVDVIALGEGLRTAYALVATRPDALVRRCVYIEVPGSPEPQVRRWTIPTLDIRVGEAAGEPNTFTPTSSQLAELSSFLGAKATA